MSTPNNYPQLETGVHTFGKSVWCETREGYLIRVNGLERGTYWNGVGDIYPLGVTAPAAAPTLGESGGGACLVATYYCAYRYVDVDGVPSSLSPVAEVAVSVANNRIDWSVIAAATEARIPASGSKELYRSLADAPDTMYLVATIANATTTYTDTTGDTALAALTALPVLNDDGTLHARRFEPPPTFKRICVQHEDRYIYAGDVNYNEGTVSVSGTAVTGVGTAFTSDMVGWYLYIDGEDKPLDVSAHSSGTSLTLGTAATGSPSGVNYALRPAPSERRRLYYSERGEPESVPQSQNAVDLMVSPTDYGDITALVNAPGAVLVCTERAMYRFSFSIRPDIDGSILPVASRGCLNQDCWKFLGDVCYLMDELGAWQWSPGGGWAPLSGPIQDVFRDLTVDFGQREWFFVSVHPIQGTVRFHVVRGVDASTTPKAAYCYNPRSQSWWLETYPVEMSGACLADTGVAAWPLVGGETGRTILLGIGTSDMLTLRGSGTVESTTAFCAPLLDFGSGVVGSPLVIRGANHSLSSAVSAIKNNGLIIEGSFSPEPDDTSVFSLDGAGSYSVSYGGSNYVVAFPSGDPAEEFGSGVVGQTLLITSGTGNGQSKTVDSRFAPTVIVSPGFRTAEYQTGTGINFLIQHALFGTATSGNTTSIVDGSMTFPADVTGTQVAIIAGTNAGEIRPVTGGGGSGTLTVAPAFSDDIDDTSVYCLGAVELVYQSKIYEIPPLKPSPGKPEPPSQLGMETAFLPTTDAYRLDLQLFWDHDTSAQGFLNRQKLNGMLVEAGSDRIGVPMEEGRSVQSTARGFARYPFAARAHGRPFAHRFVSVKLLSFQGTEQIDVYRLGVTEVPG